MTEAKNVIKILKSNPSAYIYYHDQGAFVIYKSRKAIENLMSTEYGKNYDKKCREITLYEGEDNYGDGYLNIWAEIAAILLKLEIDTI